mgnify:CR=1 FL=1
MRSSFTRALLGRLRRAADAFRHLADTVLAGARARRDFRAIDRQMKRLIRDGHPAYLEAEAWLDDLKEKRP